MLLERLPHTAMVRETYWVMVNILLFILLWLFHMLPQTLSQLVFLPGHIFWYSSWNRQMFLMDKKFSVCSIHWLVLISINTEEAFHLSRTGFKSWAQSIKWVETEGEKIPIFIFFYIKEWLVKNVSVSLDLCCILRWNSCLFSHKNQ